MNFIYYFLDYHARKAYSILRLCASHSADQKCWVPAGLASHDCRHCSIYQVVCVAQTIAYYDDPAVRAVWCVEEFVVWMAPKGMTGSGADGTSGLGCGADGTSGLGCGTGGTSGSGSGVDEPDFDFLRPGITGIIPGISTSDPSSFLLVTSTHSPSL